MGNLPMVLSHAVDDRYKGVCGPEAHRIPTASRFEATQDVRSPRLASGSPSTAERQRINRMPKPTAEHGGIAQTFICPTSAGICRQKPAKRILARFVDQRSATLLLHNKLWAISGRRTVCAIHPKNDLATRLQYRESRKDFSPRSECVLTTVPVCFDERSCAF